MSLSTRDLARNFVLEKSVFFNICFLFRKDKTSFLNVSITAWTSAIIFSRPFSHISVHVTAERAEVSVIPKLSITCQKTVVILLDVLFTWR